MAPPVSVPPHTARETLSPPPNTQEATEPRSLTALLIGATGMVGRLLLAELLRSTIWERITVLARRPKGPSDPRLLWHTVDFETPASWPADVSSDVFFNCMGTTIKAAGSREAFRRVDLTFPIAVARAARRAGAHTCISVSATGANPRSRVFYSRIKGELEAALSEVGFDRVWSLRPSLLLGDREEHRTLEKIGAAAARVIAPALCGRLRPLRPIAGADVARVMVRLALQEGPPGFRACRSDEIQRLAAPPGPPAQD